MRSIISIKMLEKKGLIFSGVNRELRLVETIEVKKSPVVLLRVNFILN